MIRVNRIRSFWWIPVLGVLVLLIAVYYPRARASGLIQTVPVPPGDREIAWIHTTTNSTTWERFVAAWLRLAQDLSDLDVDDSQAFQTSTATVPEIAIGRRGQPGKLRIRWYKLRNDATADDWIRALAQRNPAPLAIIGGGSTDRAVDLALALKKQETWHGDRPPLLITTATADRVAPIDDSGVSPRLNDIYDDRTFRFCFSNRQMAGSVLDFVGQQPALRPTVNIERSLAGLASGLVSATPGEWSKPDVLSLVWKDDPYSSDLHDQFLDLLNQPSEQSQLRMPIRPQTWTVEYSVGGATRTNYFETQAIDSMAGHLRELPPQRSLLVLPAVVQPSRRVLQSIVDRTSGTQNQIVVVTGDGISANAMVRDGDFAWPVEALHVPLVFFAHSNPFGWDESLNPPNTTEEIFHFVEMARLIVQASSKSGVLVEKADYFIAGLRSRQPAFFNANGERLGGTGEYVIWYSPESRDLTAWRRDADRAWKPVRSVPLRSQP